jgi:hypothetical protein
MISKPLITASPRVSTRQNHRHRARGNLLYEFMIWSWRNS